ncbi:uncharacterized protein LOC121835210 [Ixodes scapularis]|uniref:uncharacterized protein LOC121835210 n=1 Tax=Ixodes scapularis TaxID=6945 RepID=UPI001C38145C|nr:uncharacterized protein LOC121835210 [Ixodes scapularis]
MKHSQCPGPDGVAPAFFKMITQHTLPSLARVLQSLFDVGAVHVSWQHALVTPIHKGKGKPTDDVTHYRPVSITSIICRTFERVVNGQLLDFLEGTGYLSQSQHGLRHNRSCETALATLSHFVSNCIDNRTETDLVQLDLSNAFDTLDIGLLLRKVSGAGIQGFLLKWLSNFLSGRSQQVVYRVRGQHVDIGPTYFPRHLPPPPRLHQQHKGLGD